MREIAGKKVARSMVKLSKGMLDLNKSVQKGLIPTFDSLNSLMTKAVTAFGSATDIIEAIIGIAKAEGVVAKGAAMLKFDQVLRKAGL